MRSLLKTGAVCVALLAGTGAAAAQDAYGYDYNAPSAFEGAYVGGYAGGIFNPNASATGGLLAGANFELTDGVLAGVEAQGGVNTNGTTTNYDALMLAKGGVLISPETFVYGAAGAGVVGGTTSWALGGGAEVIAMDSLGVRGEVVGTGGWGGGLGQTKATLGIVWHMQ